MQEGLRFEVTGPSGKAVFTDMPAAVGGTAGAPPWAGCSVRHIASCTAIVMAMCAARLGSEPKTLAVTVESVADQRGPLGLDEKVSAAFTSLRVPVRIGADSVAPDDLRALATWGDVHSSGAVEVEIV